MIDFIVILRGWGWATWFRKVILPPSPSHMIMQNKQKCWFCKWYIKTFPCSWALSVLHNVCIAGCTVTLLNMPFFVQYCDSTRLIDRKTELRVSTLLFISQGFCPILIVSAKNKPSHVSRRVTVLHVWLSVLPFPRCCTLKQSDRLKTQLLSEAQWFIMEVVLKTASKASSMSAKAEKRMSMPLQGQLFRDGGQQLLARCQAVAIANMAAHRQWFSSLDNIKSPAKSEGKNYSLCLRCHMQPTEIHFYQKWLQS